MQRSGRWASRIEPRYLLPRHVASIRMSTERRRCRRTISIIHEMVMDAVGEQGLAPAGPLFARFHRLDHLIDLEAGLILAQPIEPMEAIRPAELPGGDVLHLRYRGDDEGLVKARSALVAAGASDGHRPAGAPWECYIVDFRDSDDPAEWLTDLYLPVRPHDWSPTRQDKPDRRAVDVGRSDRAGRRVCVG